MSSSLLFIFAGREWYHWRRGENPIVSAYYGTGSALFAMALMVFVLPSVLPLSVTATAIALMLAAIFDAFGFAYIARVPLYLTLPSTLYIIWSHMLWLASIALAIAVILLSRSYISQPLFWSPTVVSVALTVFIFGAFGANVWLFYSSMRQNGSPWTPKVLAIFIVFISSGIGTIYVFLGTDPAIRAVAETLVLVGVMAITFGSFSRTALEPMSKAVGYT